jgi:hypothetical protein
LRAWGFAAATALWAGAAGADTFRITFPNGGIDATNDGRVILVLTPDGASEPLQQIRPDFDGPQIFGVGVEGARPGTSVRIGRGVLGFPAEDLAGVRKGEYFVQAVFHKYTTYRLANGKVVKLPAARGAGQNFRAEPGNIVSSPVKISFDPARAGEIVVPLTRVLPPVPPPKTTKYIRHFRFQSPSLSKFWGTPVYMTGHVLVPRGFDEHPEARYPLIINHGHFPATFEGFRETPPDTNLKCVKSERFNEPCYNRIEQEEAHALYRKWTSDKFPRFLIVQIDHSNPYYDDSYAVNSANLGPYGDAITREFIPALEKQFRGLGAGWARFLYGGSTGGWESLAAQVFYPNDYNGAFVACPDPIDFRQNTNWNLYEERNAFWREGPFGRIARPSHRNYLGQVSRTMEAENRWELVLGDKTRSGQQWDIWEAVYSPQGADGYPQRVFDKRTGVIDKSVAEYWRNSYDLRHILERDWKKLAPSLRGKIRIYVGDMDNYYLNNATYLMEDFLKRADPPYEGEVKYGDRFEHCWNGDPNTPNARTRLRYHTMYVDQMLARMQATAPRGADLTSWRY